MRAERCLAEADVWKAAVDEASAGSIRGHLDLCSNCRERVVELREELGEIRRSYRLVDGFDAHSALNSGMDEDWLRPIEELLAAAPATRSVAPLPARIGRYVVLGVAGVGGQSTVYRAWDPDMDRIVAVKLLHQQDHRIHPSTPLPLTEEARTLARFTHPGFIQVFDVGRCEAGEYVVMEFIDGPTLADFRRSRMLNLNEILTLMLQIAETIAQVHLEGFAHLDLKPDNILIRPTAGGFELKVIDFGLAWRTGQVEPRMKFVCGTPGYMPPEQLCGDCGNWGPPSDVYGLGAILHFLVTGDGPCDEAAAGSVEETFIEALESLAGVSRSNGGSLHLSVVQIHRQALQHDRLQRQQDAGQFVSELKRALKIATVRRRRLVILTGLALVPILSTCHFLSEGWCVTHQPTELRMESPQSRPCLRLDLRVRTEDCLESEIWLWTNTTGGIRWQGAQCDRNEGWQTCFTGPEGLEVSRSVGSILGLLASNSPLTSEIAESLNQTLHVLEDQGIVYGQDVEIRVTPREIVCRGLQLLPRQHDALVQLRARLCDGNSRRQMFELVIIPVHAEMGTRVRRLVAIDLQDQIADQLGLDDHRAKAGR